MKDKQYFKEMYARQKAYRQTPEYKQKRKKWDKKYHKNLSTITNKKIIAIKNKRV